MTSGTTQRTSADTCVVRLVSSAQLFQVIRRFAILRSQLSQRLDVRDLNFEDVQLRPKALQFKIAQVLAVVMEHVK